MLSDKPLCLSDVTEDTIKLLLDSFYRKIKSDPELGPVFASKIAPDQWPAHLVKMYAFWSALMLGTRRYKGNPLLKHAAIPNVDARMFRRWLTLFGETADETFSSDLAMEFRTKAERVADSLNMGLLRYRVAAAAASSAEDEDGACSLH